MQPGSRHPDTDTGYVLLNGDRVEVSSSSPLLDVLAERGIDAAEARGIAVAVNDEVVPRRRWQEVMLHEGDRVEVVTAKQGG